MLSLPLSPSLMLQVLQMTALSFLLLLPSSQQLLCLFLFNKTPYVPNILLFVKKSNLNKEQKKRISYNQLNQLFTLFSPSLSLSSFSLRFRFQIVDTREQTFSTGLVLLGLWQQVA